MRCHQQNEVETKYKEEVLLVLEKNELPTKNVVISSDLLETYLELL